MLITGSKPKHHLWHSDNMLEIYMDFYQVIEIIPI